MELLGVLLLLAQTTAALDTSREYHFVREPATWPEAQSYCRENFADLATIETDEDMARVARMIANSGSTYVWMGLYDDVDSWRWSLDNTSLYAGGNTVFGDWVSFTPNNKDSNQHCVVVVSTGLRDRNCEDPHSSVCYDEPSNTYIAVTTEMTWKSAQSYCRQEYTDLASIRNQEEMQYIMYVTQNLQASWIGLSRETWKWSDQSDFLFRKWGVGEPNSGSENCGCASVSGLHDAPCNWRCPFICSAPLKKMVKVVLKCNGNLDLTDPKIQEAILKQVGVLSSPVKQVEKDMKGAGIQQKFGLTWRKQPTGNVFTLTSTLP